MERHGKGREEEEREGGRAGRGKGKKRRGEETGKGEMGVDPTKFWKKLTPLWISHLGHDYVALMFYVFDIVCMLSCAF